MLWVESAVHALHRVLQAGTPGRTAGRVRFGLSPSFCGECRQRVHLEFSRSVTNMLGCAAAAAAVADQQRGGACLVAVAAPPPLLFELA